MKQFKKEYEEKVKLAKITNVGPGQKVLIFNEHYEDVFSKGFIAIPSQDDLRDFKKTRTINWNTLDDCDEIIGALSKQDKELLEVEKNKLSAKIAELTEDIKNNVGNAPQKKQRKKIYQSFSFDFDNPEGKIYRSKSGLTIIDWGMCSSSGIIIPPPPPPPPEEEPQTD
jgi:hypothetical protein